MPGSLGSYPAMASARRLINLQILRFAAAALVMHAHAVDVAQHLGGTAPMLGLTVHRWIERPLLTARPQLRHSPIEPPGPHSTPDVSEVRRTAFIGAGEIRSNAPPLRLTIVPARPVAITVEPSTETLDR